MRAKAYKLQMLSLRSSLERLDEITLDSIHFEQDLPSLREGLDRAHEYGQSNDLPRIAEAAERVKSRLFPARTLYADPSR